MALCQAGVRAMVNCRAASNRGRVQSTSVLQPNVALCFLFSFPFFIVLFLMGVGGLAKSSCLLKRKCVLQSVLQREAAGMILAK